jgi:hypothetical protein
LNGIEFSFSTDIGLIFCGFSMGLGCMKTPTTPYSNREEGTNFMESSSKELFRLPVGEFPHLQVLGNQPHPLMSRRNPEG